MDKYKRYILIAINRPAYDEVLNICAAEFAKVYPDNILSVNENKTGTQAIIKIVSDNLDYIDMLPLAPLQITEDAPVALVRSPIWEDQ